jgi:Transposase DDE domain
MDEFAGAYGDKRRAAAVARLSDRIVACGSVVIREVGETRKGEISAHRILGSCHVTPGETLRCVARATAATCAGRRVVVAQDTTEQNFPGRIGGGLGGAGRLGETPGFFIHAAIAVDADDEAVLGLVEAQIWTRRSRSRAPRRHRDITAKESHRWLRTARRVGERLCDARQIIVVGDRENDIYEAFVQRPGNVELIIRAAQDRVLATGGKLFAATAGWAELGRQTVRVPSRGPGDKARDAVIRLRAGVVRVCRPMNDRQCAGRSEVTLTLVEARETGAPPGATPLHWRLLTTLPAQTATAATEAVGLYRLRWRIEQTFRTLKSDGLKLNECQTHDPWRLFNLSALALDAAVKTIQLVDARDGSGRPASDVASEAEIAAANAVCPTLEGKTERQRNPHPVGNPGWLSWIAARLGGWNCYYKPPGPKTMQRGWDRLRAML